MFEKFKDIPEPFITQGVNQRYVFKGTSEGRDLYRCNSRTMRMTTYDGKLDNYTGGSCRLFLSAHDAAKDAYNQQLERASVELQRALKAVNSHKGK